MSMGPGRAGPGKGVVAGWQESGPTEHGSVPR